MHRTPFWITNLATRGMVCLRKGLRGFDLICLYLYVDMLFYCGSWLLGVMLLLCIYVVNLFAC